MHHLRLLVRGMEVCHETHQMRRSKKTVLSNKLTAVNAMRLDTEDLLVNLSCRNRIPRFVPGARSRFSRVKPLFHVSLELRFNEMKRGKNL